MYGGTRGLMDLMGSDLWKAYPMSSMLSGWGTRSFTSLVTKNQLTRVGVYINGILAVTASYNGQPATRSVE